ncbi:MAG: copper resistance protein CopC, partial [Actinomycetota bacterium]|nr:copper resistance protein CopC [Actinomycetota bacterium]
MIRKLTLLNLASIAVLLAPAAGAAARPPASPQLASSTPEAGSEQHQAPERVELTFSEPLDTGKSWVGVFDECRRRLDAGDVEVMLNEMSVGIAKTPAGKYTVVYQARGVGGVTGTTNGTFDFVVHAGESCDRGGHSGHGDGGGNGAGDGNGHGDGHGDGDGDGHGNRGGDQHRDGDRHRGRTHRGDDGRHREDGRRGDHGSGSGRDHGKGPEHSRRDGSGHRKGKRG